MHAIASNILRPTYITRAMLRAQPEVLFAFGDNMQRAGLGGQARAMRGEPNAVGVPTKWAPHRGPTAYFTDADWSRDEVRAAIDAAFDQLAAALRRGGRIAFPADGLGTGRAELANRAPRIARHITDRIAALEVLGRVAT
jgi:nucleoid DNA-binding protein